VVAITGYFGVNFAVSHKLYRTPLYPPREIKSIVAHDVIDATHVALPLKLGVPIAWGLADDDILGHGLD
jgi:hypothetical protein